MIDVAVLRWPEERVRLEELTEAKAPRLVIVADGHEPPLTPDCCCEWMWQSGGEREFRIRWRQLALRGLEHQQLTPSVDELGMLHFGLRAVALPPQERAVFQLLLDAAGSAVSRQELVAKAWPHTGASATAFATLMSRLRARISGLGLTSQASGTLYRLGPVQTVDAEPRADTFDDELDAAWRSVIGR